MAEPSPSLVKSYSQLLGEHLVNYRIPDGPNAGSIRPAWIVRLWPLVEGQPQTAQLHIALDTSADAGSQGVASKAPQGTPDGSGVYPVGSWWYADINNLPTTAPAGPDFPEPYIERPTWDQLATGARAEYEGRPGEKPLQGWIEQWNKERGEVSISINRPGSAMMALLAPHQVPIEKILRVTPAPDPAPKPPKGWDAASEFEES